MLMPSTTTTSPAFDGYAEIGEGIWLEAGAISPTRSGRVVLLTPDALGPECKIRVTEIARAFTKVTGWYARVRWKDAQTRADGWVIVVCDFTELAGPIPEWVIDPEGCWWAEPLFGGPVEDDRGADDNHPDAAFCMCGGCKTSARESDRWL